MQNSSICLFLLFAGLMVIISASNLRSNTTSDECLDVTGIENNGASISTYPTRDLELYLVDLHFISGNLSAQYIAYHYCHFLSPDFMECTLYNGTKDNSRLTGTEYFITEKVFKGLPLEERKLWHSHPFEVKTGLFVAPDLTADDEFKVMEWLMGTYGKVTESWRYDLDFPLGVAQLGMALALDTQVDWALADEMDKVLNLTTTHQQRRQQRESLVTPTKVEGADNYLTTGEASQYEVYYIMMKNNGKTLENSN